MSGRRAAPTRGAPTGRSRTRPSAPTFRFAKVPGGKVLNQLALAAPELLLPLGREIRSAMGSLRPE
jgi:hypothetical protein